MVGTGRRVARRTRTIFRRVDARVLLTLMRAETRLLTSVIRPHSFIRFVSSRFSLLDLRKTLHRIGRPNKAAHSRLSACPGTSPSSQAPT